MDYDAGTDQIVDRDGGSPSRRPSRRILGTVALFAAGGIVGAALGLSGGASAQETPTPTQSTAPDSSPDDGRMGKGRRGGHGPGGMKGLGIHGEFVVKKADGGYQTVATQNGEVTAVSPTSISVKSEDGYTATYVVTAETLVNAARDGIATVKTGDTVHVMATKSGDTRTAVNIVDKSRIDASRRQFAPPAQNAA